MKCLFDPILKKLFYFTRSPIISESIYVIDLLYIRDISKAKGFCGAK